ncbi:PilN domain-containing protein [Helicovermis profundi]|uniref:Uncharacterized protein n=1 Tax=Helicovermis profundi TaxID=3065157 RepID=A0AAU9ECA5_9FIRM|nr:hypothetical protein HLPR_13150 [Clostridia bacterium S502]
MNINLNKNKNSTSNISNNDYLSKTINLLPHTYIKKKKNNRYYFVVGICVLAFTLFSINYLNQLIKITNWYDKEIYSTKASDNYSGLIEKINNLSEEKKSQDLLFVLKKRIDAKVKLVTEIENTNKSIVYIINIVEKEIPKSVIFKNMNVNSTKDITISAIADTNEQIAEFIYNLKKLNYFDDVFVDSISDIAYVESDGKKTRKLSFNIICSYGGESIEANK